MTLSMYMVMSIDGITALSCDKDIHEYSSREDREFFLSELKKHDAVITGRVSARHRISLPRFVLTKKPDEQPPVPGTTYLGGSAREIYSAVEKAGYKSVALLGGASTNYAFLKEGLVDELFLTIEPVMLGKGIPLSVGGEFLAHWELSWVRRLNESGTLVLAYKRKD